MQLSLNVRLLRGKVWSLEKNVLNISKDDADVMVELPSMEFGEIVVELDVAMLFLLASLKLEVEMASGMITSSPS